jgi:hypothetical protein
VLLAMLVTNLKEKAQVEHVNFLVKLLEVGAAENKIP